MQQSITGAVFYHGSIIFTSGCISMTLWLGSVLIINNTWSLSPHHSHTPPPVCLQTWHLWFASSYRDLRQKNSTVWGSERNLPTCMKSQTFPHTNYRINKKLFTVTDSFSCFVFSFQGRYSKSSQSGIKQMNISCRTAVYFENN